MFVRPLLAGLKLNNTEILFHVVVMLTQGDHEPSNFGCLRLPIVSHFAQVFGLRKYLTTA